MGDPDERGIVSPWRDGKDNMTTQSYQVEEIQSYVDQNQTDMAEYCAYSSYVQVPEVT